MTMNALKRQGFTLAEMAVVMILIGIAMTMGLKMVTSTLENASYSETKSKQERIKIALIGYLRTNGRLPCPDNAAGVASGVEVSPCINAGDGFGVVPWQTLGIPRDTVQDGWGNFFSYTVANGTAGSKNWTSRTLGNPFDIKELTSPTTAFIFQELDTAGTALIGIPNKAVVVILSHGKNGFGAKTTKLALRIPTTDAGAGEITNAAGGATFVLRPVTEDPAAFNGPYDDLLAYMSPQDLLQPLVSEGTLKACYAYCPTGPSCTFGGVFSCPPGDGYCTGSGLACTSGGVPTCSAGAPQCVPPTTGCTTTVTVPVGTNPVNCS